MITSMIDGGIRMPSVPAEAMVPTRELLLVAALHHRRQRDQREHHHRGADDAGGRGHDGAHHRHRHGQPARDAPQQTCSACEQVVRRAAALSTVPMKMNIGTATSTGFGGDAAPDARQQVEELIIGSNTSNAMPIAPKTDRDAAQHERHRVAGEQTTNEHDEQEQREVVADPAPS